MSVVLELPPTIQAAVQAPAEVEVRPGTIRAILDELFAGWPDVRPRLVADSGGLHRFVNVYLGEVDIRLLAGLDSVAVTGQRVVVLSAVSGG